MRSAYMLRLSGMMAVFACAAGFAAAEQFTRGGSP